PAVVAGVIAVEKQRGTLHDLLVSRLSSGEIIVGKLASRLLHVFIYLLVGLPVLGLLTPMGGVDPKLFLAVFAVEVTTAFFLAALVILVSTYARRVRDAVLVVYLLELIWLILPWISTLAGPPSSPILASGLDFVDRWIAATCPLAVFPPSVMGVLGMLRR